ncbi:dynein-related subfamily AAA family protein [Haloactinopolyspora alba]|uniref:Dynein-related subfamily AAA family protein n=2 Tax=Haloactinopolyspora alba TaxID=648780 RepID=A0A2P8EGA0_9ACTN|nr:dynein-related subfamily AAA family protein [Haloactinopolyspora alba]
MNSGGEWLAGLKQAFQPPNNLTSFYFHGKFLDWAARDPAAAQSALEALWDIELEPVEAVRTFASHLPDELSGPGSRANLASFLLTAIDATQLPIYKFTVFENAYRSVGLDPADRKTPHGAYAAALDFLDTYGGKLAERSRPQRDRLDLQGLLWTVFAGEAPETWSADEKTGYANFVKGQTVNDLGALVARFRDEIGYPPEGRVQRHREREDLAASLSREALAEPDVDEWRRFAGPVYGSPGPQPGFNTHLQTPEGIRRVADAFGYLLYGEGELHERIDALQSDERRVPGLGEALITKALAVTLPDRWFPTYVTKSRKQVGREDVLRLLQLPPIPTGLTLGQAAIWSNDTVYQALKPHFPDDAWGMQEFAWWALKREVDEDDTSPVDPVAELAGELFLSEDWLRKTVRLLHDKRQIVFYGPPGTGKTYVARKLAALVAHGGGSVETIQFHPSYAYEDFVEGYRPKSDDAGQISYEIVDGPLKRLAQAAQDRPEVDHVLLIDEINRANTSKVLGELYYLLEYRDEEMRLQYSSVPFSLPSNLKIIATMNTADRSIALLDAALRRRFHFLAFFPDREPIDKLLSEWLAARRPEMQHVVKLVEAANEQLKDRDLAIGPSHFLREDLDEESLELIWEHSVLPYLEEEFFADPDQLQDFELSRLRDKVERQARAVDAGMAAGPDSADEYPESP